jgi:hypothetical protein
LWHFRVQAKASDVVEGAAERVQQNTSSSTLQNAAENVKKAAKAGDSAPMHGRTAIITGVLSAAMPFAAPMPPERTWCCHPNGSISLFAWR